MRRDRNRGTGPAWRAGKERCALPAEAVSVVLHIVENERDELDFGLLALILRIVGPGLDGLGAWLRA
jgi:hypothetical protein